MNPVPAYEKTPVLTDVHETNATLLKRQFNYLTFHNSFRTFENIKTPIEDTIKWNEYRQRGGDC